LIFYNLFLKLYWLGIYCTSPFNPKAKKWLGGRRNLFPHIASELKDNNTKRIWMHCASLGEFEQGRPVLEGLKKQFSDHQIIVTFFSPSGFDIKKNDPIADFVCYLPLDSKSNAKRFVEMVKPNVAIFVKYEFWIHYINELYKKQIPVYLISAKFRGSQIFFSWYGKLFKNLLHKYRHIFVQDEASKNLLTSNGIENCQVAFDTRFDRVYEIFKTRQSDELIERFTEGSKIFIAGSTWPGDEDLIVRFINENATKSSLKFIIAPHEIKEARIQSIIKKLQVSAIRYSEISKENDNKSQVLIIDNIGMLSWLYRYANIAYIGGGFAAGIHNILEPAVFGMPVIFGPRYQKFNEANELVKLGGAFSIKDYDSFFEIVSKVSRSPEIAESASKVCSNYVAQKVGGSQVVVKKMKDAL
jgi:3-deoxy-D-manno-octulosonic-acid transferase